MLRYVDFYADLLCYSPVSTANKHSDSEFAYVRLKLTSVYANAVTSREMQ